MEFKVKEVGATPEKSVQEAEKKIVTDHVESPPVEEVKEEEKVEEVIDEKKEITEEEILSFLKTKYERDISSLDEIFTAQEKAPELPEDVSAYLEYRKKTGRGYDDYMKLSRDFDEMSENDLLSEYFLATEEGIDRSDLELFMEDFEYDEDTDDERDIKKSKLAKKKAIAKAKKFFNEQKEMYKQPNESIGSAATAEELKELEEYKQYVKQSKTNEEEVEKKREWFLQKTNDVFSKEFKGFEFNVGNDKKVSFNLSNPEEQKKLNLDSNNFIKKFIGDDGLIKDAVGYHKALTIAMDPDRFAKHFYDQGASDAVDGVNRKIKNIDMSERVTGQPTVKDGMKIKEVGANSGRGLKIKSKKS